MYPAQSPFSPQSSSPFSGGAKNAPPGYLESRGNPLSSHQVYRSLAVAPPVHAFPSLASVPASKLTPPPPPPPFAAATHGAATIGLDQPAIASFPPALPAGLFSDHTLSLHVTASTLGRALAAITQAFKANNVDVTFKDAKFKWKCHAYFRNQETHFASRLFAVTRDSCVLQSQRLSGDAVHFYSLFAALENALALAGLCEKPASAPLPVRGMAPMPLPDEFKTTRRASEEEIAALLDPCFAEFMDVQCEGLRALANHLADNPDRSSDVLSAVDKLIRLIEPDQDVCVRRLAASSLCGLPSAAEPMIVKGNGLLPLAHAVVDDGECCELRRHATRLLIKLCSGHADDVGSCFSPGLLPSLAHSTQDDRLRELLERLHRIQQKQVVV